MIRRTPAPVIFLVLPGLGFLAAMAITDGATIAGVIGFYAGVVLSYYLVWGRNELVDFSRPWARRVLVQRVIRRHLHVVESAFPDAYTTRARRDAVAQHIERLAAGAARRTAFGTVGAYSLQEVAMEDYGQAKTPEVRAFWAAVLIELKASGRNRDWHA